MKNYEITPRQLRRLRDLISTGESDRFYSWHAWKDHIRPEVLRLDNNECVICASRGKYARAVVVHHVQHLTDAPELALSPYDPKTGKRQLISLCKKCHEEQHTEQIRFKQGDTKTPPLTVERWD